MLYILEFVDIFGIKPAKLGTQDLSHSPCRHRWRLGTVKYGLDLLNATVSPPLLVLILRNEASMVDLVNNPE